MSPDSIYYLQTAENFKNGYGISIREMEMKLRKNDGFLVIIYPFSRFYLPTNNTI